MRSASLLTIAALALAAPQACGQRYFIAPPTAPDMRNPGFYYMNPFGVIYGPNYCVRPPFPAYQGALPVPSKGGGQGGGPGQFPMAQYAANPQAFTAAMQKYQQGGGFCGPQNCQQFGQPFFPGFPRHPWARSPRDFFMYDTAPMLSPYNYGYSGAGGRDGCD